MKKEILNTGEDLSNPSVIKTQTGYMLFLTRYDNNTVYRIYSSVCDFEFNCSTNLSQVIMPNISNNSEKNGVFAGHPFKQGNRTYLFFGAWGGDGFKLKLAYSDDLAIWQRCQYGFYMAEMVLFLTKKIMICIYFPINQIIVVLN